MSDAINGVSRADRPSSSSYSSTDNSPHASDGQSSGVGDGANSGSPVPGQTGKQGPAGPANGQYDQYIDSAAKKYGVDPALVKGVMAQESQGNTYAESPAGAEGLMQIKPDTASALAGRDVTAAELQNNPELNIDLGTKYLAQMISEKGSVADGLGAYNQGPDADWQSIPESQNYVKSIMDAVDNGTLPNWG